MGAWSTRIFSNDITADILAEYKILLGYGISPEETYEKIYGYFSKDFIGKDDEDDFWLGIAYFQWKNGILSEDVKANALRCIEDVRYLERWKESGKKVYEKRKNVLVEFKNQLLYEVNPTKKKFPKCPSYYREKTDWEVGDLIAYKITQEPYKGVYEGKYARMAAVTEQKIYNKYFLLRVIDIRKHPVSQIYPDLDFASEALVMLYDWYGTEVPSPDLVKTLEFIPIHGGVQSESFDKNGNYLEMPIYHERLISAIYLSKEYSNAKVCETIVLENDQKFCKEKPQLWCEHPESKNNCPSQFNFNLAFTYTDLGLEKRFWGIGEQNDDIV